MCEGMAHPFFAPRTLDWSGICLSSNPSRAENSAPPATMEWKTGLEPSTLTLARWCFPSGWSALLPGRAVPSTQFRPRPLRPRCSRAVYEATVPESNKILVFWR